METKPDRGEIEAGFTIAYSTAACLADLLAASQDGNMELVDDTIQNAGFACLDSAKTMKRYFEELLDLYIE